ncbi:MAG: hypothetical protein KF846_17930 [Cyclobacteriaceae bacterium]|nr:hypothetical protein [Cyclobacteriaceae bacterium]
MSHPSLPDGSFLTFVSSDDRRYENVVKGWGRIPSVGFLKEIPSNLIMLLQPAIRAGTVVGQRNYFTIVSTGNYIN